MSHPSTQVNENGAGLTRHGKLSYIQIPAADPVSLGGFYETVLGWHVEGRPEHISFRDTSGELIGAFTPERSPGEPGILPYVYVQGVDAAIARIEANGGQVVRPPYPEGDLWVATFRDPAGNVVGLWQAGGR